MCGIAGWIGSTVPNAGTVLRSMADKIAHRGPDDEGFHFDSFGGESLQVALAHRRLSIIDLEGGHQPMYDPNNGNVIVFNGEIYNFQELRDELRSRGSQFASNSDTEVILHAYAAWGTACVERFRGMFAFAIWDKRQSKLFLARDHFGKKPLFLYENRGLVAFASEIKSILEFPGVERAMDEVAMWEYLSYRYVPAPRSLFKNIRHLLPGTLAVWSKGNLVEQRYFCPPDMNKLDGGEVPKNPQATFMEKLDEAVRIRMVSDVPFGAFLSGGIDSSAVVGLMSRHISSPVNTYSIGFSESQYSELTHANLIAKQFNTNHHELVVSEKDIQEQLDCVIRLKDTPVSEPSDIPILLLAIEASKTVKMVLTGEGSDELLGGYPKHVYEGLGYRFRHLPRLIRNGMINSASSLLPYRYYRQITALKSLNIADDKDRLPRWFGALSIAERHNLVSPDLYQHYDRSQDFQYQTEPGNSPLRKILFFDQTSWLPGNLLERGDRMTMGASIEGRMPFMDVELARFISTLPDHYRVRGRTTKWILRQMMAELLPESILNRPKVGFRVPVNVWFQTSLKDYLYDHLTGSDSRTKNFYQQDQLVRILDEHSRGKVNHEKVLWTLLTLEMWHRAYL